MKRNLLAVVVCVWAAAAFAGDGKVVRVQDPVAGSYVVRFEPSANAAAAAAELSAAHGVHATAVWGPPINGFAFRGSDAAAAALSRNPRVQFVQEDGKLYLTSSQTAHYGLDRIDQYGSLLDNTYTYSYTGINSVLYVIDSGVNEIGDLMWRIRSAQNFVPMGGVIGNPVDPNDTADCHDHGTAVASVAAGTTYGVAKNASIVNLRVLDCNNNFATSSWVTDAIYTMIAMNDPNVEHAVANLSLSSNGTDTFLDAAVRDAVNDQITVVLSAGNLGIDACLRSPARVGSPNDTPGVITVAGAMRTAEGGDAHWPSSNWGPCVDVYAPGYLIEAPDHNGTVWQNWWGTSFAAPYAAGVAAIHAERYATGVPSTIESIVLGNTIPNLIANVPAGTPNRHLYTYIQKHRACCSF